MSDEKDRVAFKLACIENLYERAIASKRALESFGITPSDGLRELCEFAESGKDRGDPSVNPWWGTSGLPWYAGEGFRKLNRDARNGW